MQIEFFTLQQPERYVRLIDGKTATIIEVAQIRQACSDFNPTEEYRCKTVEPATFAFVQNLRECRRDFDGKEFSAVMQKATRVLTDNSLV
jgi:hypothetical protein